MSKIIETLLELNTISIIVRIVLSVLCGAFVGYERGKHGRAAGLRTHILVALGATMSAMAGIYAVTYYGTGDPTRIASGVVSGIGFLCAGIILVKNSSKVTGLTTAAGMWTTATIGIAIGFGLYIAAFVAVITLFSTLTIMTHIEYSQKRDRRFFLELDDAKMANTIIERIKNEFPLAHSFDVFSSKSGIAGRICIAVNIMDKSEDNEVVSIIKDYDGVIFVYEE